MGSLSELISKIGCLTNEEFLKQILYNLLEGLNYLHENEIIHGDIKSANVLIDNTNTETINNNLIFKLTDFGTAKNLQTVKNNIESEKKSLKGKLIFICSV